MSADEMRRPDVRVEITVDPGDRFMYTIRAYLGSNRYPYTADYPDSYSSALKVAFTCWGARREARKMLRRFEQPTPGFLEVLRPVKP